MLEVIDKAPCGESHKAPLLFVHGAWHGSWCWDEYFLDYFAEKGHRSLAVSLRGHGKSPAPKSVRFCSIADFVDDVASVADSLLERPVVVGHSWGGFVVQKYLESHDAPAKRHPWSTARSLAAGKSLRSIGGTPELARESFFSELTPGA
jgi:pimeloyl-ACP methyl ester carboxylesterase